MKNKKLLRDAFERWWHAEVVFATEALIETLREDPDADVSEFVLPPRPPRWLLEEFDEGKVDE